MGQMKDIVEAVAIGVGDIIGEGVADKYAVPLQVTLSASTLCNGDVEMVWQPLFRWKGTVERGQTGRRRFQKSPAGFICVRADDLGEGNTSCLHSLQIVHGESLQQCLVLLAGSRDWQQSGSGTAETEKDGVKGW